jgi:hypothetical protein
MAEPLTCVGQLDYIVYDDGSLVASNTVYGTFSSSDFLYIDALKGYQYPQPRTVRAQRTTKL